MEKYGKIMGVNRPDMTQKKGVKRRSTKPQQLPFPTVAAPSAAEAAAASKAKLRALANHQQMLGGWVFQDLEDGTLEIFMAKNILGGGK